MKRNILATIAMGAALGLCAQTEYNLVIEQTDGSSTVVPTSEIGGVLFEEAPVYINAPVLLRATYGSSNGYGMYTVEFGTEMPDEHGDPSRVGGLQGVVCFTAPVSEDRYDAKLAPGYYLPSASFVPGTFNIEKSAVYERLEPGEDGVLSNFIIDGAVDVKCDNDRYTISMEVTAMSGLTYALQYQGPIKFDLASSEFEPFTEDIDVTFEGCQGRYYANWFYPFAEDATVQLYAGEFNSDNQMVSGYWLNLDSYWPLSDDRLAKNKRIPDGTYRADTRAIDEVPVKTNVPYSFAPGMMMDMWGVETMVGTWISYQSADGRRMGGLITGGEFTVSDNGTHIEFDMVLADGHTFKGSYSGTPYVVNFCNNEPPVRPYTTLESNVDLNLKEPVLGVAYQEPVTYVPGQTTWYVYIGNEDMDKGDFMQLNVLTDGPDFADGIYEVNGSLEGMTILPGNVDYGGGLLFSWYGDFDSTDDEGYQTVYGPIDGGTMTVSTVGKERKFVFNFEDDFGNSITGEWQGTFWVIGEDMEAAPKRRAASVAPVR